MGDSSDDKLNRLLKGAYPLQEVSPDFTLRLWRRLIQPGRPVWALPVPALGLAAVAGIMTGIWTWGFGFPQRQEIDQVRRLERLDLFGNAPFDSIAGNYLRLTSGGQD